MFNLKNKKIKKLFLFALICATGLMLNAQTTVTFKPDATVGQDATLFMMDNGCIPQGWTDTPADLNYGNEPGFPMVRWTYSANQCGSGTTRELLKFSQLSTIPSNAIIQSAQLKLYGTPTDQNTWFPGHPSVFLENNVDVYMVTNTWTENAVTWNNQPSVSTNPVFSIPVSTSQYNWNYTSGNIANIIQSMISGQNNGFMFRLQNENDVYRAMCFASSDHSDSSLWPELTITYTVCEADFTYCVTTDSINVYTFTSLNPNYPNHNWIIDGQYVSHDPSFEFYLSPGTHKICYVAETGDDKCEKCITICVDENAKSELGQKSQEMNNPSNLPAQGKLLERDVVGETSILIFPNPTRDIWSLKINSLNEEEVEISIVDVEGKLIYSHTESLKKGDNNFSIGNKNYNKGTYILNIKGRTIKSSRKIVKE